MKRPFSSLAKSVARIMMRSNLLWEAVRRLPNHDIFYRQRYSLVRKRASRKCAKYLDRREVLSGPFKGMKYAEQAAVGSSLWPKLLGTYESELLPCFESIAGSGYKKIIDVGYAEGYYLIGFGRLFQRAELIGFDTESEAQRLCKANAEANEIEEHRLKLFGAFDPDTFERSLDHEETLVVVDCEGAENEVIESLSRDQIKSVDWLIETHDHLVQGTTDRLLKVFDGTHVLTEMETDDDLDAKCRLLPDSIRQSCDAYVQEALVSEGRQAKQRWIFATRRAA